MNLSEIQLIPLIDTLKLEKIDDAIYFSEKYSGYVSNSRLGLINPRQEGNPEKFFAGFKPIGYAPALELGSAVHSIVLQNELFELSENIGKPTAKLGAMADALYPIFLQKNIEMDDIIKASDKVEYYKGKITKERAIDIVKSCRDYWKARQTKEMDLNSTKEIIYLDYKTRETALSCIEALNTNKQVQDLLHPKGLISDPISENEQAIIMDVLVKCPNGKEFTLSLKSKIDNYTIDTETNTLVVNDVKTIGKIVSEFSNNINKFHYSREIAMYIYLLKLCASKYYNMNNPKIRANYLVVSTIPNYYSKVQAVTYNEIAQGFHEFKTLLRYVAYNIAYKGFSLNERSSRYQL